MMHGQSGTLTDWNLFSQPCQFFPPIVISQLHWSDWGFKSPQPTCPYCHLILFISPHLFTRLIQLRQKRGFLQHWNISQKRSQQYQHLSCWNFLWKYFQSRLVFIFCMNFHSRLVFTFKWVLTPGWFACNLLEFGFGCLLDWPGYYHHHQNLHHHQDHHHHIHHHHLHHHHQHNLHHHHHHHNLHHHHQHHHDDNDDECLR